MSLELVGHTRISTDCDCCCGSGTTHSVCAEQRRDAGRFGKQILVEASHIESRHACKQRGIEWCGGRGHEPDTIMQRQLRQRRHGGQLVPEIQQWRGDRGRSLSRSRSRSGCTGVNADFRLQICRPATEQAEEQRQRLQSLCPDERRCALQSHRLQRKVVQFGQAADKSLQLIPAQVDARQVQ